MAQPIYDDLGPLEQYLRMSGDLDMMPGSLAEFALEHEFDDHHYLKNAWMRDIITSIVRIIHENFQFQSETPQSSSQHEFAERFKYLVISSSLLASSLPQSVPAHSRTPSSTSNWTPTHDLSAPPVDVPHNSQSRPRPAPAPTPALFLVSFILVLLSVSAGHYITALVIIAAAVQYALTSFHTQSDKSAQTILTLDTINTLVDADAAWNAAVSEAMSIIDREGFTPISPSSPIRGSLHSCLQATATRCDNIRQLFSPLTAPAESTQLCEMYAPSPAHTPFNSLAHGRTPSGLQNPRSTSILDKRSTWNGVLSPRPRMGLGTPLSPRQTRDESLDEDSISSSHLPFSSRAPLPTEAGGSPFFCEDMDGDLPFGVMALQLQRAYRTPHRQSLQVPKRDSPSLRTSPIASQFATLQQYRHPFSMTALQHSLQAALSSKRFACCNLLALRFEHDEDDAYWEDVHSVVALLTSTLEGETARLVEALESSHLNRRCDELPTAPPTPINPTVSPSHRRRTQHRLQDPISFAPLPSSLAKFISQTEAVESALYQASDALRACTSSVRKLAAMPLDADEKLNTATSAALQAYETLRRDLGRALRDCERARDPLLGLIPRASDTGSDSDEPAVPPLAQDQSSAADSESGRGDPELDSPDSLVYVSRGPAVTDDVTRHLLTGTSASHLPQPGEEQLFEAESAPSTRGLRERPSLSRAERIALAKASRENAQQSPVAPVLRPGGEIVEELKQVISRVNDRKNYRLSLLRTPVAVSMENDSPSDAFHSSPDSLLTAIPSYLNASVQH